MIAIVYTEFGPSEVLQYKDIEKPSPKDNEVLLKIHGSPLLKGRQQLIDATRSMNWPLPTAKLKRT